jgi:hypothetical protein
MPKIFFEDREYDSPEQMTPEARARYEKAVQMLPDRDSNGIPDLLEVDGSPDVTPQPVKPKASGAEPAVKLPEPADSVLGPGVSIPTTRTTVTAGRGSKYRKWILWGVIGAIVLCIGCVSLFVVWIFTMLRSSEAYQMALATAQNDPTVQQVLGTPIKDGVFVSGSVEDNGSTGSAELEIPVNGPNQSGTLYVSAVKEEDTWRLTSLRLEAGGEQYQLLP